MHTHAGTHIRNVAVVDPPPPNPTPISQQTKLLPDAAEVCEGNVFTPVGDSVHKGGVHPVPGRHLLGSHLPPPTHADTSPKTATKPGGTHLWNAFLSSISLVFQKCKKYIQGWRRLLRVGVPSYEILEPPLWCNGRKCLWFLCYNYLPQIYS